ncbi:hypothetical protein J4558_24150 [Leptolyngbya sp. 15MV]|nr:hypothetical protein J4558_24150 [Leptolyngbya sp. 15MV]
MKLSDHHLIVSAANTAERAALELFSLASTVYPANNTQLLGHFTNKSIEQGITLGLHARKIIELCHLDDALITQQRWVREESSINRVTKFKYATNRFVHAISIRVIFLNSPTKIFGNDVVMSDFVIETNERSSAAIDIFGFAWAYLSQIAPKLDLNNPRS